MFALMLFLFSYPVTRGLYRHGVCGTILLVIFVCHHLLNFHWYRTFLKGRWTVRRFLLNATDCLLFLNAWTVLFSCVLLAGEVFSFVPFPMKWWARGFHACSTAWLFILAALHMGWHWSGLWKIGRRISGRLWNFIVAAIFCLGVPVFAQSGLWLNMFLSNGIKPSKETVPQFIAQSLIITLMFYLVPHLVMTLLARASYKRK